MFISKFFLYKSHKKKILYNCNNLSVIKIFKEKKKLMFLLFIILYFIKKTSKNKFLYTFFLKIVIFCYFIKIEFFKRYFIIFIVFTKKPFYVS